MARPRKSRRICSPPKMVGFKPYGIKTSKSGSIYLKLEEYESIRLVNYDGLAQDVAARMMNISRPTFTRIYNKALNQIAISLVEGKNIEFEGGDYVLDREWYRCKKCFRLIQGLENHLRCEGCMTFGMEELIKLS
jgi:predicted DNA-binding protein (UPF0251 family)